MSVPGSSCNLSDFFEVNEALAIVSQSRLSRDRSGDSAELEMASGIPIDAVAS